MLTFTISLNRRRPVGEPPSYQVIGGCEPPGFASLADARLFIERETQKFSNGALIPFQPTHAILWQTWRAAVPRRIIPVRMVESKERPHVPIALYAEEEWTPCVIPEWTYSAATERVFLDGVMMGNSWFLLPYHLTVGVLGVVYAVEAQDRANFFGQVEIG